MIITIIDQTIHLLIIPSHYTVKTDQTVYYLPVSLVLFSPFHFCETKQNQTQPKKKKKTQTKPTTPKQTNKQTQTRTTHADRHTNDISIPKFFTGRGIMSYSVHHLFRVIHALHHPLSLLVHNLQFLCKCCMLYVLDIYSLFPLLSLKLVLGTSKVAFL